MKLLLSESFLEPKKHGHLVFHDDLRPGPLGNSLTSRKRYPREKVFDSELAESLEALAGLIAMSPSSLVPLKVFLELRTEKLVKEKSRRRNLEKMSAQASSNLFYARKRAKARNKRRRN